MVNVCCVNQAILDIHRQKQLIPSTKIKRPTETSSERNMFRLRPASLNTLHQSVNNNNSSYLRSCGKLGSIKCFYQFWLDTYQIRLWSCMFQSGSDKNKIVSNILYLKAFKLLHIPQNYCTKVSLKILLLLFSITLFYDFHENTFSSNSAS